MATAARTAAMRLVAELTPPEGVPLHFEVAGLGIRIAAQLTDLLLTLVFVVAVVMLLALSDIVGGSGTVLMAALLFLLLRAPYYIVTELLWNGQTFGKRICGLRVIAADGRSLSPYAIGVRNLMKEAEVFTPATYLVVGQELGGVAYAIVLLWIAILVAVPLLNRKRQRLGDMIANTYVIRQPAAVLARDVARAPRGVTSPGFTFAPQQLDQYGRFELQTLEQYLREQPVGTSEEAQSQRRKTMAAICEKIRAKIGYRETVRDNEVEGFLIAFYTAQRAHLEQRKLFGEAREDKFYRDNGTGPGTPGRRD